MLRHPMGPPGGATLPAPGEPSCPCICLCVPTLEGGSVRTPHGDYFVPPEGERIYGPVAHPADIAGRDLGVPLPTSPSDQWSHELLVRNAQAEATASTTALDTGRPELILDATIPEGWRAEASTGAPPPSAGIAVDLPGEGPVLPEARKQQGMIAIQAVGVEGEALSRRASVPPIQGAMPFPALDEFLSEGETGLEGIRPLFGAEGPRGLLPLPPLVPLGTPEEATPQAPPPGAPAKDGEDEEEKPGPGQGSGQGPSPTPGVPGNGEDEGGGGGGRAQSPIRDLPFPRPPVLTPGASRTPEARTPRARPLAPGDQAPAILQPPLHAGAPPGGPRPLTPSHLVATRNVPPASPARRPGPGHSQAPRPVRAPDAAGSTRLRPGDGALPIQAPPATAATAPPPSSTPPTVTPPATAAPVLPLGKAKESAAVLLGRELRAGSTATRLVEPGPVGGPVASSPARAPVGPGQIAPGLAIRRVAGAETATPRSFPVGQAVLSPTGVDRSIEGGLPQRDGHGRYAGSGFLEAPSGGAIPTSPPPPVGIDLATPPNTLSDDTLAYFTAPRPSAPTIVPAAIFPSVGVPGGGRGVGSRPTVDVAPPALIGGASGSTPRRGKPSGKTDAYGQAAAAWSRANGEAQRLRDEAAVHRTEADVAREEADRQGARLRQAEEKWAAAGGGAHENPHSLEKAEASHAELAARDQVHAAEAEAAPLEAKAGALEAQAKEAGERAVELLEDIRRENPQTGLELAHAAADRANQTAKRLEAKAPTRHEVRQSVRERARGVYREEQLDRKRKRKRGPADYRTWRTGQDVVEARRDAPVRRELEERAATSTGAQREIQELQGQEQLGSEEKDRLAELKTIERSSRLSRQDAQVLRRLKDRHLDRRDREKSSQARARVKQRTAQGAEDAQQRERLSPAAYETWRAEQDQKEAAEDRATHDDLTRRKNEYVAVRNRALALGKQRPLSPEQAQELEALQDRARELALTEEEAQELTQASPEREEERKERAEKRAEPSEEPTSGPVGGAGPSPAPPSRGAGLVAADALATDGTPAPPAPCAPCSCVPPCPPEQRCICFEVTKPAPGQASQPERGEKGAGGGKGMVVPEGITLGGVGVEEPPIAPPDTPTVPGRRNGLSTSLKPRHPPLASEELSTITRSPCETLRRARSRVWGELYYLREQVFAPTSPVHLALMREMRRTEKFAGELAGHVERLVGMRAEAMQASGGMPPVPSWAEVGEIPSDQPAAGIPERLSPVYRRFLARKREIENELDGIVGPALLENSAHDWERCRQALPEFRAAVARLLPHMRMWGKLHVLYVRLETLALVVAQIYGMTGQYKEYGKKYFDALWSILRSLIPILQMLGDPAFAERIDRGDPEAHRLVTDLREQPEGVWDAGWRVLRYVQRQSKKLDEYVKELGELLAEETKAFGLSAGLYSLGKTLGTFPLRGAPPGAPHTPAISTWPAGQQPRPLTVKQRLKRWREKERRRAAEGAEHRRSRKRSRLGPRSRRYRPLRNRAEVEEAYRAHPDLAEGPGALDELMEGIDWRHPIGQRTLEPGDVIEQWVRTGQRRPGRHFAYPGEDPARLGMKVGGDGRPAGRELRRYVVQERVTFVESRTATLPETPNFAGGPGGGTQLFAEPGWTSRLRELSPGGAK